MKVEHRLFARLWILGTSMARGSKKSPKDCLVEAIEKRGVSCRSYITIIKDQVVQDDKLG